MDRNDEKMQPSLDRWDGWIAVSLGLFSLAMYARTLLPGLVPNDSAEFQTLAYTLDHAHTTGYQVYLLLAKLFSLLPVQDVAYRVNLFSAFMGGLTVALVYLTGKMLVGYRLAGVVGAFALAISATFWSQAIMAEVYTAGSAFTAAILLMVLVWRVTDRGRYLFAAGLLGGLGVGVHGSILLLAPAVLVFLLLHPRRLASLWKPALGGLALGILLFVLAFALVDLRETHASIFWAAYWPHISRWDLQPGDLDSFGERFLFLVFARQWRSQMFVDPAEVVPGNIGRFIEALSRDFALPLLLIGLLGLLVLLLRQPRLGLFFLVAIVVHNIYVFNYNIGDIHVFFISFYVYFCALIAAGTGFLMYQLGRALPNPRLNRFLPPALALLILALAILPFAESRLEFLRRGEARWDFMGLAPNRELENWHGQIRFNVRDLPQNAIVLTDWYNIYGYSYEAHVEQGRTDLLFMESYPYSSKSGMADSLFPFLRERIEAGHPVFTMQRLDELQRGGFTFSSRPVGVTNMFYVEVR